MIVDLESVNLLGFNESDKNLGLMELPLLMLSSPSATEDELTRNLDHQHVQTVKKSMKDRPEGLARTLLVVWLAPISSSPKDLRLSNLCCLRSTNLEILLSLPNKSVLL